MEKEITVNEKKVELTNVVNVRVSNIRPKYQSLKEWMEDKNNIYIGRKGVVFIEGKAKKVRYPKEDSIWANPFKITENQSRNDVISLYEIYIRKKIENENLQTYLLSLKGKSLGCWCFPEVCHGNILVKLIEEFSVYK